MSARRADRPSRRVRGMVIATITGISLIVAWLAYTAREPRPDPAVRESSNASRVARASDPSERLHVADESTVPATMASSVPTPTTAELVRVTIRARLPRGAPVEGLTVALFEDHNVLNHIGDEIARGVTGSDGNVVLRVPAATYHVRASYPTIQANVMRVRVRDDSTFDLSCGLGRLLRVRAVGEDETPIEGARVWTDAHGLVERTGADGWASVGAVPTSEPRVHVEAVVHLSVHDRVPLAVNAHDGSLEAVVRLTRGRPLRIRVLDAAGRGVRGAGVFIYGGASRSLRAIVETDAEGDVVVEGIRDSHDLLLRVNGYRDADLEWPTDRPAGEIATIRLPGGRTVRGAVIHGWTGEPVPHARILVYRDFRWVDGPTADVDGRFELTNDPGRADEPVMAMAYGTGLAPNSAGWGQPTPVENGAVLLRAYPTMRVEGRVVDSAGDPVAGARLRMAYQDVRPTISPFDLVARSGDDGTFAIPEVPAADGLFVLVESSSLGMGWTERPVEAASGSDVVVGDIAVQGRFRLDVPIEYEDGRVVEMARLALRWPVRTRFSAWIVRDVVDGVIDPIDVLRQSATVEIEGPGFVKEVMEVSPTTSRIVVTPRCRVTGRVVDAKTGMPLRDGVRLLVNAADRDRAMPGNSAKCEVLHDGWFEADGLRKGRYVLEVRDYTGPNDRSTEIRVSSPDTQLGDVLIE